MPQTITTGYKALCEAAEREVETLPTEEWEGGEPEAGGES